MKTIKLKVIQEINKGFQYFNGQWIGSSHSCYITCRLDNFLGCTTLKNVSE